MVGEDSRKQTRKDKSTPPTLKYVGEYVHVKGNWYEGEDVAYTWIQLSPRMILNNSIALLSSNSKYIIYIQFILLNLINKFIIEFYLFHHLIVFFTHHKRKVIQFM